MKSRPFGKQFYENILIQRHIYIISNERLTGILQKKIKGLVLYALFCLYFAPFLEPSYKTLFKFCLFSLWMFLTDIIPDASWTFQRNSTFRLSGWTDQFNRLQNRFQGGTLSLNRPHDFSFLSSNSFLHPFFKSKFTKKIPWHQIKLNFWRPLFRRAENST